MPGVSRTPAVAQDQDEGAAASSGATETGPGQENSQADLAVLQVLMVQVLLPNPNPVIVKAFFERLSPRSKAMVMTDRAMMPKVVAALTAPAPGGPAQDEEDDSAIGGSWNPLAHPLLAQAAEAVSGTVQAVSDRVWGPAAPAKPPATRQPATATRPAAPATGPAAGPAVSQAAGDQTPGKAEAPEVAAVIEAPGVGGLVTRPGARLYAAPGGKSVGIRTRTDVTVVETRIDDAEIKNGNNTKEAGKIEWTHIRSEDGQIDGWIKFGAVTVSSELSDEMGSATTIPVDEIEDDKEAAVATIWNEKGGYIDANRGSLPRAVAVAVMKVESGGLGFTATGDATIRFEVHKLFRNGEGLSVDWGKANADKFDQHFRPQKGAMEHEINVSGADAGGAWTRFHGSQSMEWDALELATSLADRETALRCISIGAGQVMGFNAPKLGYKDATEMFDSMNGDVKANVGGIFGFIKANPEAAAALAAGDYVGFAAEYNGKSYAADYGRIIAETVTAFEAVEAKYLKGTAT